MESIAVEEQVTKYPAYKDSGVDWIGETPAHWDLKRLKYIFNITKRIAGELGYSVLSITQSGIKIKDIESGEGQLSMDYSKYQLVYEGDFAMNHMDLLTGYVDVSSFNGVVSPDYRVFTLIAHYCNKEYLLLLLQLCYKSKIFYAHGQGVSLLGRWRFPAESFNNFIFPIPPLEEQTAIAKFLDRKTAQIDKAIGIKEKQIELLKERRQILIHNAVTRGLNPDAPMKDSGVEWIGEIPAHWEVKALKHIAQLQSGETITSEKFTEEGFPVYGGNGFRGYTFTYTNDGEYALIGRQGALCGNVNYAQGKFFASEHAITVYSLKGVRTYWLGETIKQANFNRLSQSAAQPGIAVSVIKNILFPYPPINEQVEIENFLVLQFKKTDAAISSQEKEIEKLKEYKASLINSAVTGKIKVV